MTSGRTSNTSRAYWELRAEQVMDRVFTPSLAPAAEGGAARSQGPIAEDDSIEVEVREAPAITAPRARAATWRRPAWRLPRPGLGPVGLGPNLLRPDWLSTPWQIAGVAVPPKLAMACSGGLACLTLATSTTLWLGWNQANQDLRQERTIRLLEGIRGISPGSDAAATAPAGAAGKADPARADGLPPPPPDEPWIQELGQLEGQAGRGGGAAPLQVPVNGTLAAPAPVASAPAPVGMPLTTPPPLPPLGGGLPELVGVVQIPGKPGSAIFQVGGSSTNASSGESIGSSGWRLVSTSGDSAVIERGGVTRRVSISSGF